MKKFALVLLTVMLLVSEGFSQVVISVDESVSKNSKKSLPLAIGASLLLPGMGQHYLGENSLVKAYIWTDVALWMATFGS